MTERRGNEKRERERRGAKKRDGYTEALQRLSFYALRSAYEWQFQPRVCVRRTRLASTEE